MDASDSFLDLLPHNSMHFKGEVVLRCTGCRQPLLERVMLQLRGRLWHPRCLRCIECGRLLTHKCYQKNQLNFCEEHFYRKYGTRCGGCDQGVLPLETVRRVRHLVFHLQCFVCLVCGRQLVTGDHFHLLEDQRLICEDDYAATKGVAGKRPRTSIASPQLDTLKTAYRRSAKPSRSVREQLAAETGLDMRVVQVWFQNRRAKEKRLKKEVRKPEPEVQAGAFSYNTLPTKWDALSSEVDLRFAFLQQIIYFTHHKS